MEFKRVIFLGLVIGLAYYWRSFFYYWLFLILFFLLTKIYFIKSDIQKSLINCLAILLIAITMMSPWLLLKSHFDYGSRLIIQGMLRTGLVQNYSEILETKIVKDYGNFQVPEDGAVVGFNKPPIFSLARVIHNKLELEGRDGADFLFDYFMNEPAKYWEAVFIAFKKFTGIKEKTGAFSSSGNALANSIKPRVLEKFTESERNKINEFGLYKNTSAKWLQVYRHSKWLDYVLIFSVILAPILCIYSVFSKHYQLFIISTSIIFYVLWHCLSLVVIGRYSIVLYPLCLLLLSLFVQELCRLFVWLKTKYLQA